MKEKWIRFIALVLAARMLLSLATTFIFLSMGQ